MPDEGFDWAAALRRLPRLTTLRAGFVAEAAQRLPPLVTSALHGALGRALAELDCPAGGVERCACAGESCGYRALMGGGATGATPALALAPLRPFAGDAPVVLEAGARLEVRVTLIGRAAEARAALLVAALRRAGEGGLGLALDRDIRRPLRLEETRIEAASSTVAAQGAVLDFVTPARLLVDDHLAPVDADLLWRALARRLGRLATAHGAGPFEEASGTALPSAAPFDLRGAWLRPRHVTRFSARQGRRMRWSGWQGAVELVGPELPALWPILEYVRAAQIGKGTSFGFGRFELTPMEDARV